MPIQINKAIGWYFFKAQNKVKIDTDIHLNPIQDEEVEKPQTSFSPVISTNEGISSPKLAEV